MEMFFFIIWILAILYFGWMLLGLFGIVNNFYTPNPEFYHRGGKLKEFNDTEDNQ
jgi:hypothetical protein